MAGPVPAPVATVAALAAVAAADPSERTVQQKIGVIEEVLMKHPSVEAAQIFARRETPPPGSTGGSVPPVL